jgi:hypothetical protein
VSGVRSSDDVRRALLRLDIALRDHPQRVRQAVEDVRQLLDAGPTPTDAGRLRIALGHGERWLQEMARRRKVVVERLKDQPTLELYWQAVDLVRDPDASAEEKESVAAARAHLRRIEEQQRATRERERAARREAQEREKAARAARYAADERQRAEQREAEKRGKAAAKERALLQDRLEKTRSLALAVRGALKKAAREQRTTTLAEVQQKTGMHQLGCLGHEDQVELLAAVDNDTPSDSPLWSTLLAATGDGAALRLHRDVALRLGRSLPDNDTDLLHLLFDERSRLHRSW